MNIEVVCGCAYVSQAAENLSYVCFLESKMGIKGY